MSIKKRIEHYTQLESRVPYGDFNDACICLEPQRSYLYYTGNGSALIKINLRPDTRSTIFNALEAELEILPPNTKIPIELTDLLLRNKFKRMD